MDYSNVMVIKCNEALSLLQCGVCYVIKAHSGTYMAHLECAIIHNKCIIVVTIFLLADLDLVNELQVNIDIGCRSVIVYIINDHMFSTA